MFFVLIFVVFAILNTKYNQITDSCQEAPLISKNNVCLDIIFGLKKQFPAPDLRQPETKER